VASGWKGARNCATSACHAQKLAFFEGESLSGHTLPLLLQDKRGGEPRPANVRIENAVIAGWTGRDAAALEKHIKELESWA